MENEELREYEIATAEFTIPMFDMGMRRFFQRKWVRQFEGVTSIFYFVDLCCYSKTLGIRSDTLLMDAIPLFGPIVNTLWFPRSNVVLVLTNVRGFKKKLASVPLEKYFPDYVGGNDFERAVKYIISRFRQQVHANKLFYHYLIDIADTRDSGCMIFEALNQARTDRVREARRSQ